MRLLDSRIWYIRSADRFSGELYDFFINVPPYILNHDHDQFVKITLVDFVLKRNKYPIDTNNNKILITETNNSVLHTYTYSITPGNYNVYNLATTIGVELSALSPYYNYSVVWDSISGYYTFSATTKTAFPFQSIDFNFNITSNAGELLGFNETIYAFSGAGIRSSIKMVSLTGETAVYLRTSLPGINYDFDQNIYGYSDILAKIPIIVPPYGTIVFQDNGSSLFNILVKSTSASQLQIRLTNARNQLLQFQDDWTMAFKLEFYEPDNKNEDLLNELKQLNETSKLNLLYKNIKQ